MFKQIIQSIFNKIGYKIERMPDKAAVPYDMDEGEFKEIYNKCKDYTMTSVERMYTLYKAIQYVSDIKIPGDIVECGVWKGGSSMVSAYALLGKGDKKRKIYLYDTFKGMSEPTDKDLMAGNDYPAQKVWDKYQGDGHSKWCYIPKEEVKKNMLSTGYPKENLVFVEGIVEDTLPKMAPDKIVLLRLDTDWYESTYHELIHLFPRLSKGGLLVLDDYGHWKGVREAVDKHFKENGIKILLNRIDNAGVIGIKIND